MKARIIGTVILLLVLFVVADLAGMFDSVFPSGSNSSQQVSTPVAPPMSSADNDMKGLKIN